MPSCFSIYPLYGHAQVLKDWHLFVIVMIFVLVDVIILTVVSALDGVRFNLHRVKDIEVSSGPNVSREEGRWRGGGGRGGVEEGEGGKGGR